MSKPYIVKWCSGEVSNWCVHVAGFSIYSHFNLDLYAVLQVKFEMACCTYLG